MIDMHTMARNRPCKVSGAVYFIDIGVTIATQSRHCYFYSRSILETYRVTLISKLSTVLAV